MNILFVCKGNIFRSMSAEYLTKKHLEKIGMEAINVSSAGTEANPQAAHPTTVNRLKHYHCDPNNHTQRKISKEILAQQDLIICMGNNHREVIEDMGFDCLLFNEIAFDISTDVPDIEEFLAPGYTEQQKSDYIIKTINYIHNAIPHLIDHIIQK
ncbi:TPA: low molecular weight phosphatase family protein [Patescibacteria group bacterium]|nr:hypothetical protein P148_SR1C00001G0611 [candidate division SR1 bacterium RAAC1_SR1_1]HCY21211.1 low molecular weight phosphatase family protein [Candidatus Gracilibacteria bacterium]